MTLWLFKVSLPSGRLAVYLGDLHGLAAIDARDPGERLIRYGTQVAHEFNGNWYEPGGWTMITDVGRLAQLDRAQVLSRPAKVPQ